jgi:predicted RNase H-like nuclease
VTNDLDRPSSQGRYVVEVHPAVALWRWCQKDYDGKWEYKTNKTCRGELSKLMSRRIGRNLTDATDDKFSDDELDAWTAWYLARCWLDRKGVTLLGSAGTGSFLLPEEPELQKAFEQFLQNS